MKVLDSKVIIINVYRGNIIVGRIKKYIRLKEFSSLKYLENIKYSYYLMFKTRII